MDMTPGANESGVVGFHQLINASQPAGVAGSHQAAEVAQSDVVDSNQEIEVAQSQVADSHHLLPVSQKLASAVRQGSPTCCCREAL